MNRQTGRAAGPVSVAKNVIWTADGTASFKATKVPLSRKFCIVVLMLKGNLAFSHEDHIRVQILDPRLIIEPANPIEPRSARCLRCVKITRKQDLAEPIQVDCPEMQDFLAADYFSEEDEQNEEESDDNADNDGDAGAPEMGDFGEKVIGSLT